ncbi:Aste57867_1080 [Aphanomyces stellatus]|uniref:Aste57867_1080 protein n=1 Tax=Aphanomyces stellatus TaxID=120398 RepID=A0A485K5C7_9STRA|nr:hypothetical protein As57867_001079 [Aphanomyces stellatus]VFT78302.1 Aste57867_1080 [Aphanomyces stellatus]
MKVFALLSLAVAALVAAEGDPAGPGVVRDIDGVLRTVEQIAAINNDADTNRKCHQTNNNYLPSLSPGKYAASSFHNCFRTSDQIFEYVDKLVAQNPTLLTKFAISKTVKGKTIYAYKLSKSNKPQSLYYESLIHAREWIAGSSLVFSLSSFLDDIANKKAGPYDLFNVIFVPIVNIDGYDISWNANRYQRKNANQVDLTRNFPSFYKNPNPPRPSDEDYPGTKPFSEPETKGIADWLKANNNGIAGWIDLHSYAGLVMYPYGDTQQPIGGGEDEKFQLLGKNIQQQMGSNYKAETSATLYPAYGCFDDYHYRTYKKPVLTVEVAGTDFVAPISTIRTRGTEVYKGFSQFAKEVVTYNGGKTKPRIGLDDAVDVVEDAKDSEDVEPIVD